MIKIIILEKLTTPGLAFQYVLRAQVPEEKRVITPDANPAFVGETPEMCLELTSGEVKEIVGTYYAPAGQTVPDAFRALIPLHRAYQKSVTGVEDWNRFGFAWNGSAWA